ncbi:hypothetical protein F2Q70_00022997 [Brassica cretica]|uniref:Uncharacterized protein n=1 Tax=Brassica cretica TaxID=69181 RepID=A0A8S9GX31_BRACR|nr:hypothetical protein F2Q70_00022997 [Brassica cretica]
MKGTFLRANLALRAIRHIFVFVIRAATQLGYCRLRVLELGISPTALVAQALTLLVQLPIGASARQPLLREQKHHDRYDRYEHRESKHHHNVDVHSSQRKPEVNGYRRTAYARHDDSSDWSWMPKERVETQREIVESIRQPYAPKALQLQIGASSSLPRETPVETEPHNTSGQRIASLIITPSRQLTEQDDNVTKRSKTIPRSITFSPMEEVHPHNAQMIDALSEMEIVIKNKNDDGKEALMACDGDDLLGQDLMELEEGASKSILVADSDATGVLMKERAGGSSSTRGVERSGIPLGLPIRKAEFLHRGSPKHRSKKAQFEFSKTSGGIKREGGWPILE